MLIDYFAPRGVENKTLVSGHIVNFGADGWKSMNPAIKLNGKLPISEP